MPKKLTAIVLSLLGLALVIVFFTQAHRPSEPLLTIVRTSMPSCQTVTCVLSSKALTLSRENDIVIRLPMDQVTSRGILQSLSNTPLSTLERLYQEPHVDDGFEFEFRFHRPEAITTIAVRNSYVPVLYRILDECDKLLPAEHRFTAKQHFVRLNEQLDLLVAQYATDPALPEDLRQKIIGQLQEKRVELEK